MTQKDKELLLIDLCARLPYGVMIEGLEHPEVMTIKHLAIISVMTVEPYKPYLRPMSSMTEEEIKELLNIDTKRDIFSSRHLTWHLDGEVVDYLNSHHFDYRGLIEKGLAIEAPEGIYNIKEE